jgi:uncharacterized membrane protein
MRALWTPRWLLVHVAAVVMVVGFLLLCWWQVTRAVNGNLLSFGYAIEWPAFAAFVVFVWVKEARQAIKADRDGQAPSTIAGAEPAVPVGAGTRRKRVRDDAAYDDSGDSELAAYNRYLAWLNANPHASPSEYTG